MREVVYSEVKLKQSLITLLQFSRYNKSCFEAITGCCLSTDGSSIPTNIFVRFQDKLSINISDSQNQTVSLMAYGSGTTIVSDPPLAPAVKLGPQFSCQPVKRWFQLTNSGRRPQQIYWTTEGFLPYRTKKKPEYNPEDMRYQVIT